MTLKREPPDEDHQWPYVIIEDWQQLAALSVMTQAELRDPRSHGWLFRGSGDASRKLDNGLYRALQVRDPDLEPAMVYFYEQLCQDEFEKWYVASEELKGFGSEENDQIQRWVTMQHYGAPTRLLDWSKSLYVAAYFAAMSSLDEEDEEKDGAIWCFDPEMLRDIATLKCGSELSPEGVPLEAFRAALESAALETGFRLGEIA
jgi:hypothetical protein